MKATEYAKGQLEETFSLLNTIAEGMDDAQYNWKPGGTCNTAAMSHAHTLGSIDFFVNMILGAGQLRWPGVATANNLPQNTLEIWKFEGTVPLAPLKEYGKQVQKDALDYVAKLSDTDLDEEIDTRFFGKHPRAWVLQLVANHTMGHGGDVAAVKGMQGLKGLPF